MMPLIVQCCTLFLPCPIFSLMCVHIRARMNRVPPTWAFGLKVKQRTEQRVALVFCSVQTALHGSAASILIHGQIKHT